MSNDFLKKIVSEPAELLEKGIEVAEQAEHTVASKKTVAKISGYLNALGPGLITGAADDDPSGIATYSQTGAQFGFQFIWLSLFTFPLMAVVQEMCARIGLSTGRGLAANVRMHFPKWFLYGSTFFLVVANTFNIAADLGAMAEATKLVFAGASFTLLVVFFALASLLLQIFTTYQTYARYLKYLTFILFSYVAVVFFIHINWHDLFIHLVVPTISFTKDELLIVCAVLGTTISPYLFFWQSSQEVEEEVLHGKTTVTLRKEAVEPTMIRDMRLDVWSGMLVSNVVMFFIIAACGATLHQAGITTIQTAGDAALALKPFAGNFAFTLFALGIIGTGMLATPVLAGASSYAVSETFRFKEGLYRKLKDAYAFYGVIIIGMVLGILLNFVGLDPIRMLLYAAVLNGLVAPLILVAIVYLASNKKVMGVWVNRKGTSLLGWFIIIMMVISGTCAVVALF